VKLSIDKRCRSLNLGFIAGFIARVNHGSQLE